MNNDEPPDASAPDLPPPPDLSPAPREPESEELLAESKNWALGAHLSALSGLVISPIGAVVGPLVVWLAKRNDDPYVERHAKEALNFNISFFIYELVLGAAGIILVVTVVGVLLIPLLILVALAIGVVWLVFVIIAAIAASRGEEYQYPLTIRLVS